MSDDYEAGAHLSVVEAHTEFLSETITEALTAADTTDALSLLRDLRAAVETLRQVDATITRHLYLNAEHGTQDVDGIGRVRIYRSRASERWDERGAAQAILDAHLSETGEQPRPWEVVEWLLAAGSFGYFRKTALRAIGVDPETVYDSRPGKPTVELPKPSG